MTLIRTDASRRRSHHSRSGGDAASGGSFERELHGADPHREVHRIETFSDAVFAIACTLLVLGITVPHVDDATHPGNLWPEMKRLWPSFAAYLIGFESLFVAWAGQHRLLSILTRSSKPFLYANGLLLLAVTFIPFPTAVLAEYIDTPQASAAVMLYSAAQMALNLGFLVWWLCTLRPVRLLPAGFSDAAVKVTTIQILAGAGLYAGTIVLANWFPVTALIVIVVCQFLWIAMSIAETGY